MASIKKLGIWMDHYIAHLMEFSNNPFEIKTIESKYTYEDKVKSFLKGESNTHSKEQLEQSKYYKKLITTIKKYDEVVLFGPTSAKEELFNVLSADNRFEKIKIQVKQTDKMSERQQHAFVRECFAKA